MLGLGDHIAQSNQVAVDVFHAHAHLDIAAPLSDASLYAFVELLFFCDDVRSLGVGLYLISHGEPVNLYKSQPTASASSCNWALRRRLVRILSAEKLYKRLKKHSFCSRL